MNSETAMEELVALLGRFKSNPTHGKRTELELLGVLLAWYCASGKEILQVAYYALEEANYHTENKQVEALIAQLSEKEAEDV